MKQKSYHIIVVSVVFAVLVWVSINMSDEYTLTKRIPIVVENLKDGKSLKFPIPKTMIVHFKGKGWQLAGIVLSNEVKYFIDASALTSERYVVTSREFFEHVKLPASVQPITITPETLVLALTSYKEKRIPVNPNISLNFRDGYGQVGRIHLSAESVTLGGSSTIIEPLHQWQTMFKHYDNLRTSIDEEVSVEEPEIFGVEVIPQKTRIQVDVQPLAEKTFSGIGVFATATPAKRQVIFIPPKIDVIVRGGIDQLAKLTLTDFQAIASYQALTRDSSGTVTPTISLPSGITLLRRIPEQIEFVIRKKL